MRGSKCLDFERAGVGIEGFLLGFGTMAATAEISVRRGARKPGHPWYPRYPQVRAWALSEEAKALAKRLAHGESLETDITETELFGAMHACAYRAAECTRSVNGNARHRPQWLRRRRLIRAHLVEKNRGLVYLGASRFRSMNVDRDELQSEGFLALVRAVDWFDPWRGIRFSTYAYNSISRAMMRFVRRAMRYRKLFPISFDVPIDTPPRDDMWSDLFVDRLHRALSENLGELTDRELHVLGKRFPTGDNPRLTLEEIGDRCGLSKERVRQIQNRALRKLRAVLEADPHLQ